MKPIHLLLVASLGLASCAEQPAPKPPPAQPAPKAKSAEIPPLDPKNIVSIAVGSKDHTTLVTALKAADYVTSIANPGPLTVFAPTNAAFEKLPKGTVEGLLQPDKQDALKEILKYHATTSVYETDGMKDGQLLAMANGAKVTIKISGQTVTVNDAKVLASIRASNGIVHVIDGVLLPPSK